MSIDKPIWSIGFRPFFLFGALAGSFLVLSWALQFYTGNFINNYYSPTIWHGHEMIFGFAVAILAGFLLTASQNWSGKRGVHGWPLVCLVLLWTLGRFVPFLPGDFLWLAAPIDLSFIPTLIIGLCPYLLIKGQERNRKILLILGSLFIANLMVHYGHQAKGLYLAVDVFVVVMLLIAGRVLPFFKAKAMQIPPPEPIELVEKLTATFVVLYVLTGFFNIPILRSLVCLLLAALLLFKWLRWRPIETLKIPILAVLYVAYLWIIIGFVLTGLGSQFGFPLSWAMHCFTLGGIGGLTLAMMTRVSLGHTGRAIHASRLVVLSYFTINLAVFFRLLMPWLLPDQYGTWILITGSLWSISFLIFLIQYTKILICPRGGEQ